MLSILKRVKSPWPRAHTMVLTVKQSTADELHGVGVTSKSRLPLATTIHVYHLCNSQLGGSTPKLTLCWSGWALCLPLPTRLPREATAPQPACLAYRRADPKKVAR